MSRENMACFRPKTAELPALQVLRTLLFCLTPPHPARLYTDHEVQ